MSPFIDAFLFLRDVPYKYASQLIGKLNGDATAQANSRRSGESGSSSAEARSAYARGEIDYIFNDWRREQYERAQADLEALDRRANEQRTLGYSTKDDIGTDGDDTEVSGPLNQRRLSQQQLMLSRHCSTSHCPTLASLTTSSRR